MPDFSTVRVGDKVFSMVQGDGIVKEVKGGYIKVSFSDVWHDAYFTMDGKTDREAELPTLYWSKPRIEDPPPPKRMVRKKQTMWANIYPDKYTNGLNYVSIWDSRGKANEMKNLNRIALAQVEVEWEQEEEQ